MKMNTKDLKCFASLLIVVYWQVLSVAARARTSDATDDKAEEPWCFSCKSPTTGESPAMWNAIVQLFNLRSARLPQHTHNNCTNPENYVNVIERKTCRKEGHGTCFVMQTTDYTNRHTVTVRGCMEDFVATGNAHQLDGHNCRNLSPSQDAQFSIRECTCKSTKDKAHHYCDITGAGAIAAPLPAASIILSLSFLTLWLRS